MAERAFCRATEGVAWLIFPWKWMTLATIPCAPVPHLFASFRPHTMGTLASTISQE